MTIRYYQKYIAVQIRVMCSLYLHFILVVLVGWGATDHVGVSLSVLVFFFVLAFPAFL